MMIFVSVAGACHLQGILPRELVVAETLTSRCPSLL